jgi:glutamate N-acetyltransferase / amino-acid N-acetyltransferase
MRTLRRSPDPILVPKGFSFAAVAAGIKASGRPDLALANAERAVAAAVFTRNRVVAAPVEVGRASLKSTRGHVEALLVNSGNANCATGAAGIRACQLTCRELARHMQISSSRVFPSSTGIIGVPLPTAKIVEHLSELIASLAPDRDSAMQFADAILTTDTRRKIASRRVRVKSRTVTMLGVAKGSGMIHPQLATMLVYIFVDFTATSAELNKMLREAVEETFNRISVDGDTSTNDTVLLMASGKSGVRASDRSVRTPLRQALREICASLAEQIVTDGEGVQHVIELCVEEARTVADALQVARTISHSPLVKTAWAGADPNWGRILAAAGRSGVAIDPQLVSIHIDDQTVCRNGASCKFDAARAHHALRKPQCAVRVRLGQGKKNVRFLTTDLTPEYVRINADYST